MPEGDKVCHGDLRPANVPISGNKATVMGWVDASHGNPLAYMARTTVIFLGAANTRQTPDQFRKVFTKLSHAVYLREYFRLHPHGMEEYRHWLPIAAAASLTEGMPELEKWLVEQAEKVR